MILSKVVGGEVTPGIPYVEEDDGVKFIDLGSSRIKLDQKHPPLTENGRVLRATFKKGLLTAEEPRDIHTTGLFIQARNCTEVRNGNFYPGQVDRSYMGIIDGKEYQFHAMNGSSRFFQVIESPTKGFRVLYQNGEIVIREMTQMEIAAIFSS